MESNICDTKVLNVQFDRIEACMLERLTSHFDLKNDKLGKEEDERFKLFIIRLGQIGRTFCRPV